MVVHGKSNVILSSKTVGYSFSLSTVFTITAHSFFLLQAGDKHHSHYIFMKGVEESEGKFEKNRGIITVQKQGKAEKT